MHTGTEGTGSGEAETENALGVAEQELTVESEVIENDEANSKETARETVARILKETKGEADNGSESAKGPQKADNAPLKPDAKKEDEDRFDPDLSPPERLKAHEKQLFNNLPKGLKRALSRSIKELEGMTTREKQEYQREIQATKSMREAVEPYLNQWGDAGLTATAAVTQLVSAHNKLVNPQTSLQTFIALGKDLGHDVSYLENKAKEGQSQNNYPDVSQHPEILRLRQSLDQLTSEREQSQVSSIVAEMAAIRDEKDAAGQVVRPLLSSDILWESVKPLVSEELRTAPDISYGEALKRAYPKLERLIYGDSRPQPTRLTPAVNNQQQTRATQAAISIRGRSAPAVSAGSLGDAPPEALRNARATAEWVAKQMGLRS